MNANLLFTLQTHHQSSELHNNSHNFSFVFFLFGRRGWSIAALALAHITRNEEEKKGLKMLRAHMEIESELWNF
jgi:hypothetical protein